MRLLDLYCGAGGAAMGYHWAGFEEIVGVDIHPQPHYPFAFIQAEALEYVEPHGQEYDVIHASPPCQAYSALSVMHNARPHPMLIEPLRIALEATCMPWIIENVFGAPLRNPTMLCGSYFRLQASNGYAIKRHRYFESNALRFALLPPCHHSEKTVGIYGAKARDIAQEKRHYSKPKVLRGAPIGIVLPKTVGFEAMQIDWMSMRELSQAIPPAYTQWIGAQILATLRQCHAAAQEHTP